MHYERQRSADAGRAVGDLTEGQHMQRVPFFVSNNVCADVADCKHNFTLQINLASKIHTGLIILSRTIHCGFGRVLLLAKLSQSTHLLQLMNHRCMTECFGYNILNT